jgi:hypothetical protein
MYAEHDNETAIEGATIALAEARLDAEGEFFDTIRKMDGWDNATLADHISAMIRRNAVHDDPACLETATVAEVILGERDRQARAAAVTGGPTNVLHPPVVDTAILTKGTAWRVWTTEASNLPTPGPVYRDACDVGYTLRSHRTGEMIVVAEAHREYRGQGSDRELAWIDYRQVGGSAPVFTLRVWND